MGSPLSYVRTNQYHPALVALYGRRRVSLIGAFFALHDRNTKKSASLGWRTRKKKKKHQRKRKTSESLQRRVRLRRILPSCARDIARFKDEEDGEDLGADEVRVKEIERNVPRVSLAGLDDNGSADSSLQHGWFLLRSAFFLLEVSMKTGEKFCRRHLDLHCSVEFADGKFFCKKLK